MSHPPHRQHPIRPTVAASFVSANIDNNNGQIRRSSAPWPPLAKTRKNPFLIPESEGGFTPADLVLALPPPLQQPRPATRADAKWNGGQSMDMSMFQHLSYPERFARHLRRLHEDTGSRMVITQGEMYRGKTRLAGQTYIKNVFGLYEVEEWGDENTRKSQVEWTQWLIAAIQADRRREKMPRCPPAARKMLRIAVANVMSAEDSKRKRFSQRMLEGTRLEVGILQAAGLKKIARTCCVRKLTTSGEDAVFQQAIPDPKKLPEMTGEETLDRYGRFLILGRMGQPFDDAKVIAGATREKSPVWETLRRQTGLLFRRWWMDLSTPKSAPVPQSSSPEGRPSPNSPDSLGKKKRRKPWKQRKPYWTLSMLKTSFGPVLDEALRRAGDSSPSLFIVELQNIVAGMKADGATALSARSATHVAQPQSRPIAADIAEQMPEVVRRGTKRPLSEIQTTPGSAQEAIKRAKIDMQRRRSSPLVSSSAIDGSARKAIRTAQAENERSRSSSLIGSSPPKGSSPPTRARKDVRRQSQQQQHPAALQATTEMNPRHQLAARLQQTHPFLDKSGIQRQTHQQQQAQLQPLARLPVQATQHQQQVQHQGQLTAIIEPQTQPQPRQQPYGNRQMKVQLQPPGKGYQPQTQVQKLQHQLTQSLPQQQPWPQPWPTMQREHPSQRQHHPAQAPVMPTQTSLQVQPRRHQQAFPHFRFPGHLQPQVPAPEQRDRQQHMAQLQRAAHQVPIMSAPVPLQQVPAQLSAQHPLARQPRPQEPTLEQQGLHQPMAQQQPYPAQMTNATAQRSLQHQAPARPQRAVQSPAGEQPQPQPPAQEPQIPGQLMGPRLPIMSQNYFRRQLPYTADAAQRVVAGSAAHHQAVSFEIHRQYQIMGQLLEYHQPWNGATQQVKDGILETSLGAQFLDAEANFLRLFPQLPILIQGPHGRPLLRQALALTWIISNVNPAPVNFPDQIRTLHAACCQLEARVMQLEVLRAWTRYWEERLIAARLLCTE